MVRFSTIGGLTEPHSIDMVDGSYIEIDIYDLYKKPSQKQKYIFESLDLETYYYDIKGYVFDEFDFDEDDYECDENGEEYNDYKMGSMIEKFEKKITNYVKSELRKVVK
jgi:hypothetical protein